MKLCRAERRMEYNQYEIEITNEYLEELNTMIAADFELEEGEVILTEADISNIWLDYEDEYTENHPLRVIRRRHTKWDNYTIEDNIFHYVQDYLDEDICERDPYTYNSETYDYDDTVEER